MSPIRTQPVQQEIYIFRGKEILSDAWTVAQQNYALSLNGFKDRYKLKPRVKTRVKIQ